MIPQDLQYSFPLGAYLLPVAFLFLLLYLWYFSSLKRRVELFAQRASYFGLLQGQSKASFWLKAFSLALAWMFAVFALMQPKGDAHYINDAGERVQDQAAQVVKRVQPHDVVFVVDASLSMGVTDGRSGRTRLSLAKEAVDQIVAQLEGQRAALIAFTSEVNQLSPATTDLLFVRLMNEQISLGEGGHTGTDIENALEEVHEKYLTSIGPKQVSVVLISDGEGEHSLEQLLPFVRAEQMHQARFYTIGVGTEAGAEVKGTGHISKLNSRLLQGLADKGRGRYYSTEQLSVVDIAQDFMKRLKADGVTIEAGEQSVMSMPGDSAPIYDLFFQVPLALAILFLILAITVPDRWRATLSIFLLFTLPCFGTTVEEANEWFEAGAYEEAIEKYEALLDTPLSIYEESVVRFNLGTALLEQEKWERAVEVLRSIPNDKTSPLLNRRANTNLVVARLREEVKTDDLPKKVFLLRDAMQAIFKGNDYHCELSEIIQAPECKPAPNLKEMRAFIENDLSTALQEVQQYQITSANFIEGIPLLLSYVQAMLRHLQFLETKAVTPQLDESYRRLFLAIAESWTPLWSHLKDRPNPPQRFINARQYNRYALIHLRNRDYDKAHEHFVAARDLLADLLRAGGVDTPLQESLIQLARSYQLALLQEPVQEVTLRALAQEQKQISLPDLKETNQILAQAVSQAEEGRPDRALIFVKIAQQELRHLIRRRMGEASPGTVLEAAIEAQEHALSLARIQNQIQDKTSSALVKEAQKQVVVLANPFFDEVIQVQKAQYRDEGRCQEHPWQAVVPLFYQGLQAARYAADVDQPIPQQEMALMKWRGAVEAYNEEEPEPRKEASPTIKSLKELQEKDIEPKPEVVPSLEGVRSW